MYIIFRCILDKISFSKYLCSNFALTYIIHLSLKDSGPLFRDRNPVAIFHRENRYPVPMVLRRRRRISVAPSLGRGVKIGSIASNSHFSWEWAAWWERRSVATEAKYTARTSIWRYCTFLRYSAKKFNRRYRKRSKNRGLAFCEVGPRFLYLRAMKRAVCPIPWRARAFPRPRAPDCSRPRETAERRGSRCPARFGSAGCCPGRRWSSWRSRGCY